MVEISRSVSRGWTADDDYFSLLISSKRPPAAALEIVSAALGDLIARDEEEELIGSISAHLTPKGPSISIGKTPISHRERVLAMLAACLERAGLPDAVIKALPTVRPDYRGPFLKAFIALAGVRPDDWTGVLGWPMNRPEWLMSVDDLESAVADMTDWALELDGPKAAISLFTGGDYTSVGHDALVPSMLACARRDRVSTPVSFYVAAHGRYRYVSMDATVGTAAIVEGHEDLSKFDWSGTLGSLRQFVEAAGHWCAYAHVSRGDRPDMVGDVAGHADRVTTADWNLSSTRTRQRRVDGLLYDAFGYLLAPTESIGGIDVSGTWTSRQSGSDTILDAIDPAAWFSERHPESSTLDLARIKFGSLVEARDGQPDRLL